MTWAFVLFWWRGQDLNLLPSGYELLVNACTRRRQDALSLVNDYFSICPVGVKMH